jgi:hypothetical protein
MMKINHNHGRLLLHTLYALYQGAEVVSGAYKLRVKHRGVSEDDPQYEELSAQAIIGKQIKDKPFRNYESTMLFRPLTEEELLKDSLSIMEAQINIVRDTLDYLELL